MTRHIEQPTTKGGDRDDTVTTHPAFGQIGASRVSGHAALYGSDFRHNAYMTITIRRSELHRNLSRDWHFGREELIEVALSEAQWATFVSAPNIGTGVPCTIDHVKGERIPALPDPISRVDQFSDEVKEKLKSNLDELTAAVAEIDALGIPKVKAQRLKERLRRTHMELAANLPFVARQFSEHMEETVEKAKAEVHGYMTAVIHRAGMDALAGGTMPLQIESNGAEGEES